LQQKDREVAKENERIRWHRRKIEDKVKTINDLSARDQRSKRKKWAEDNRSRASSLAAIVVNKIVQLDSVSASNH
jgi:hypothetical protein